MGNIKQINIKNRTYYLFNDMINIKDFDSSLIKIDKKSYKNIGIQEIGYITIKKSNDYEKIHSVNPFYLMIGEVIGNIEVFEKYKELWDGIKNKIENIDDGECNSVECCSVEYKYGKYFTKIILNTDADLPLNKPLNLHMLAIIVRSVFEGEGNE